MDADRVRDELVGMAEEDQRVRQELAEEGSLFDGYHPRMRAVHDGNAIRLLAILDAHGWPGRTMVGVKASEAAWLILQHSISHPALMRRGLALLYEAARAGEIPAMYVAMLDDRVRTCEGRGQLYGTQFDWDENGELSPQPIEGEEDVDARRRAVGLGPLDDAIRSHRERARRSGEERPHDWLARERDKEAWLKETGWRP